MQTPTTAVRLSIAQIARREGVHPATVFRWITDGLRLPEKLVVKLPAQKRGGRLKVLESDLEAFFSQLNAARDGAGSAVPPSTSDAIEQRADEEGL